MGATDVHTRGLPDWIQMRCMNAGLGSFCCLHRVFGTDVSEITDHEIPPESIFGGRGCFRAFQGAIDWVDKQSGRLAGQHSQTSQL